jgi:hypothetical protein
MKKLIRLAESDLHRIIRESVKRILREENNIHYFSDDPSLMDRDTYFHSDNSNEGFGMKKDFSKEFSHDGVLGDLYTGNDYYQKDNDSLRYSPMNDANLNVYDYKGIPSILAQSSDSEHSKIGKGFRGTLRDTYRETFGKEIPK